MLGRMASVTRLGGGAAAGGGAEADVTEEGAAAAAAAEGSAAADPPAEGHAAAAQQQHATLIGIVMGKTAKIQREGRGRRYRVSFSSFLLLQHVAFSTDST